MALNLKKNKEINLTKSAKAVTEYKIGLAWDAEGDLDVSVFAVDANGSRLGICYYDDVNGINGVTHSGDARDGEAEGDDESVIIDINGLDENVADLHVVITSYSEDEPVTFGATDNPVATLYLGGGNDVQCELDSEAAFGTCLHFVTLSKTEEGFVYKNVGEMLGQSVNGLADADRTFR